MHYRTALTWVRLNAMPVPVERTPGGHIRVLDEGGVPVDTAVMRARKLLREALALLEARGGY